MNGSPVISSTVKYGTFKKYAGVIEVQGLAASTVLLNANTIFWASPGVAVAGTKTSSGQLVLGYAVAESERVVDNPPFTRFLCMNCELRCAKENQEGIKEYIWYVEYSSVVYTVRRERLPIKRQLLKQKKKDYY